MRTRALLLAFLLSVALAAPADAAVTSVFDGDAECTVLTERGGVRQCSGITHTWDGAPIDVNVTLPAEPAEGRDGNYPLLGIFHGWGGSKVGISTSAPWAERGYAVFTMSDRGWGESCGGRSQTRVREAQACFQRGYNHLMDTRYEVRDAQELMARLVDQRTGRKTYLANAKRIGATGGSYGGGMSMALAALNDRKMLPNGTLTTWRAPKTNRRLRLAAAAPEIPWTDLAYSLMPNGRTLDYAISPDGYGTRVGVQKTSYVAGLFGTGLATSNYAPPQADPGADLFSWFIETSAGEPYDQNPLTSSVVEEITTHHSSYYIDHSRQPSPLLISNGWTDDLFPVDEALRFYNRTKDAYPKAFVGLEFLDYGHARGQGKAADTAALRQRQREFFDHFLKGEGERPFDGVRALTQTCPREAPSGGPFTAKTWKALAPGEVRLTESAQQLVVSGGDPRSGQAFDPIAGGGACAKAAGDDFPGTASFRLPVTGDNGFTLLGSPTIVADITSPSPNNQLAARLLDIGPDGQATLVARGTYRPDVTTSATRQVFQLHPNGWRFEKGHTAKLELLAFDAPYTRPSQGQSPVAVSNVELRLPVAERSGAQVGEPAPKPVPVGYRRAPGY